VIQLAPTRLIKHNPVFLSEEELASSFVVREAELKLLLDIIRENTGPANQHVIIIGPRGMGKTMLVLRLALAIRRDESMCRGWYPVVLPEEVYDVASEGEVWLRVLERIAKQEKEAGQDYNRWLEKYEALRGERDGHKLMVQALTALSEFAGERNSKLLVSIENLQMLLGEQSSSDAAWDFRRTLLNNPEIMLVATATTRFKEIMNAEKANFELFREITLTPLSTEDCRVLWRLITGEDLADDRIRPMEVLTGGSPRLLAILADFAARRSLKELLDDLVVLIDDHTTYFKGNVEALPPLERRVFVTLAELWQPAEAREVARRCRLEVNKTSALLKRLVEKGAVAEAGKIGRKNIYQVAERLYNIYHLMRLSGIETDRVRALVRFMVPMYGQERVAHALAAEACCQEGESRKAWIDGYREILADATCVGESLERLRQATPKDFLELPEAADIARTFVTIPSDRTVNEQKQEIKNLRDKADEAYEKGDLQFAISQLDLLLSRFGNNSDPALRQSIAWALFNKSGALGSLGRHEEVIVVSDDLIRRFGESDDAALRKGVALALLYKGQALDSLSRHDEAVVVFDTLIRRFGESHDAALRKQVACALCKKSQALKELGRGQEAIAVLDELLRRFGDSDDLRLRKLIAHALFHKNLELQSLGRSEEAIAVYEDSIRLFGDSHDADLRQQMAWAFNGRAWSVYEKKNKLLVDQAIIDAKKAIEINPQEANTYRHTLASLLGLASRWEDAFALARDFSDDDLILRRSPDDVIAFFVYAAASGKAEEALQAIKGTKAESAMEPLVVALKMAAGKTFRAPQEVTEVAKDVLKRIEHRAKSLENKLD